MKWSAVSPVEWFVLALAAVLCIVIFASGGMGMVASLIPVFLAVTILCFLRARRDHADFLHTCPASARIVNYHVETRRVRNKWAIEREYQVWAPVVEFETERGTVRADYPVYDRQRWFREGQMYEIHYCPDVPEKFYFTERKKERVENADGSLLVCLFFDAAYAVMLIAVLLGI